MKNFEDLHLEIVRAINERIQSGHLKNMNGFVLINGFISMQVHKDMPNPFVRKLNPSPMQCAGFLNQQSGEIRLFPIKALLPNAEL